jgi:hypothetical protein
MQTLNTFETSQVAGASGFNIATTATGISMSGSIDTPIGTFSTDGTVGSDGIHRTVNYSGVFGSFSNTAGIGSTGLVFDTMFTPAA